MSAAIKPRVLFFSPVRHALGVYKALSDVARTEVVTSKSREEFFEDVKGKYKDIRVIYRTSYSSAVAGPFDAQFISKLPPSLTHIHHTGAGYDQIDVAACTEKRITVTNAPDAVTDSTADLTLFLIIGALRNLNQSLLALRRGEFKKGDFGHDPQGKTLGIMGLGRIGRAVAARVKSLDMKIIYHSRRRISPELESAADARYVSFDELLAQSDVISIHTPLNAGTKHLIGAAQLRKMKKGAIIINTARGAVIDEAALVDALDSGHIGGVGLDVFEKEPKVHEGLLRNERTLIVPHMGTHSTETLAKMEAWAMGEAERVITGRPLRSVVPEQQGLDFARL
ncbi:2-hydroxyacid dehydrogenase [Rhizodiscina lignyota]|uniref:2-hydroxyacid dehydrogenase n=1 Tax=Rhizodiscina lignyota TaxID=1504668 RepID=A0A9P4IP90_9PEZI|nr:2-hydroxyacid dehydrogenase [Rhizodiscina lignyota]